MATTLDIGEALDLVRQIESGSTGAWHRFIDLHAGLIHSVIRRYLAFASPDERRELFVRILVKLHEGSLHRYDGRSRLSTWLFIFCRSRCLDHLRAKHGRRSLPAWLSDLPERDQRIFRLYYVDGLGCTLVRETLEQEGFEITLDELADTLERLECRVDAGMRKRMAYDLFAQSVGVASGRLLEFLQRLTVEYEDRMEFANPERILLQKQFAQAAEQIREFVGRLPELERRVVALRYYEGRTAREAARELSLGGQREVYTVEGRAIRRLRGMLDG